VRVRWYTMSKQCVQLCCGPAGWYLMASPLLSPDALSEGAVVSVRDPLWQGGGPAPLTPIAAPL